jgi:hypothetical protein
MRTGRNYIFLILMFICKISHSITIWASVRKITMNKPF